MKKKFIGDMKTMSTIQQVYSGKLDICRDVEKLVPELQSIVFEIEDKIIPAFKTGKVRFEMKVFETIRTQERQIWLYENGYSDTLKSNHMTGRAVDFVLNRKGVWLWKGYENLYEIFGEVVTEFCPKLKWGRDFINKKGLKMYDYPHWELRKDA